MRHHNFIKFVRDLDRFSDTRGRMFGAKFVSDSQEVFSTLLDLGYHPESYDSLFVLVGDGDYISVWAMDGIVPYLDKRLYRIF